MENKEVPKVTPPKRRRITVKQTIELIGTLVDDKDDPSWRMTLQDFTSDDYERGFSLAHQWWLEQHGTNLHTAALANGWFIQVQTGNNVHFSTADNVEVADIYNLDNF